MILYDRLIPPGILDGVRAELVYVGKQGGGPQMPQEEIDRLLVQYGTGGRTVVRLKGGDPFVFGRGGEEALVLREAGIPFEVVPGITAGIAAPAYAGIPVTHRELASGVAFVTGHENPDKPETALDWPALAAFPGTLVFYMGVKALPRIAAQLIAGGRPPREPVAVVERGHAARGRGRCCRRWREIGSVRASARPRSRSSGRSPRCASSSRGWRRGRCTGAPWRSRARGRRLARWRRGCAGSAPRSSRRPRSARSRSTVELPDVRALRPAVRDLPDGRRPALRRTCATRASWRA